MQRNRKQEKANIKDKNIKDNNIEIHNELKPDFNEGNIYGFRMLYNDYQHQNKNTECGTYSIYFISQLVSGQNFYDICKNIIKDDEMVKYRDKFFRPK